MNKEQFKETANNRGIPFAKKGMRIKVDGKKGVIKDFNSSANLNVLFDGEKVKVNCHPTWESVFYDEDENIIADFRKSES